MMYTPGGSPIFWGSTQKRRAKKDGKPRFKCTGCHHKATQKQAMTNRWDCNHCGYPLAAKAVKIDELNRLAKSLGFTVINEQSS